MFALKQIPKKFIQAIKTHAVESIIISLCIIALLSVFLVYCNKKPIQVWHDWLIVLCSLLLFSIVGIQFIFRAAFEWRGNERTIAQEHDPFRIYLMIILCVLFSHIIRILLAWVWKMLVTESVVSFRDAVNIWWGSDTHHYLTIADQWYRGQAENGIAWRLVFLPFYSILTYILKLLVKDTFYSALIVTIATSSAAGCVLYRLARMDYDKETALKAVKYFILMPTALFYTTALTEGTFMLLSLLCFLYARKHKWIVAGLLGGLAAFTRSVGVLLLVPIAWEWVLALKFTNRQDRIKKASTAASLLLIPLGFCIYLLINHYETGNAFTFLQYQREHWYQELGLFFDSPRYQLNYLTQWWSEGRISDTIALWTSSIIAQFTSLLLMAITAHRQRSSYALYFLASFVVTMGTTWLLSAPRYLLVLFPLVYSMMILSKNRKVDSALTVTLVALGQLYLYLFVCDSSIY